MPEAGEIDHIDRKILARLQNDSRISNQALADEIGLSPPACLRRVRMLRESGCIQKEISVLDPKMLGMSMWTLVLIECEYKRADHMEDLKRYLASYPEVMQCYAITGAADFALLVATQDMEHFDRFADEVFRTKENIRRFETMVVMSRIKTTFSLPIMKRGG